MFSLSQLDVDEDVLWFWTVCESAFGWPFLIVADKSMLWVLNSL